MPRLAAVAPPAPGPANGHAIVARGLRCTYGSFEALKGIDLEVARGEIFALLGPNGAGKTSAIEIFEGFRRRSGGEVTVLGEDPAGAGRAWRERIGVVLQESLPEPELTVRECAQLYAGYYSAPRDVHDTIATVGLADMAERRCDQLSGGQRRRLDVALALIGDPELLFLDEPTTGFDPAARRAAWDLVLELRALGKTIVLTTHYMDEAERLADRIAVIAAGELVATGTPGTLASRELMDAQASFTLPPGIDFEELPASLDASPPDQARVVRVRAPDPARSLYSLTRWAVERELDLRDLEVRRPSLEEIYLSLTDNTGEETR
jgi:ABC-2 type transport system ATP-binding protein